MDLVTAISGSGPAYYFLLVEIMEKLGVKNGLSKKDAKLFSNLTFLGSASLLENSKITVSKLKSNVTSPGGTTEAALNILENKEKGIYKLFEKAIKNAIFRSKELDI